MGMKRVRQIMFALVAGVIPTFVSGCFNPVTLGVLTPIPMQPWVADHINEKILNKNDFRTPVLPPIPAGYRPLCEDPPGQAEVLRCMPRVVRGVPFFYEEHRDDI